MWNYSLVNVLNLAAILTMISLGFAQPLSLSSKTFLSSAKKAVPHTPVLFIHGLDSSKHTWRNVNALLQNEGINSVSVDLRGWGSSELGWYTLLN